MEKLRYNSQTHTFTPIQLNSIGYCTISNAKVEANLALLDDIIPYLQKGDSTQDYEIWIPLPTYSHTGCQIPPQIIKKVLYQLSLVFGGANVVKSVQGLWMDDDVLYDESNINITLVFQSMSQENLNQIASILSTALGSIFDQKEMLVVARPVMVGFFGVEQPKEAE